MAWTAPKIQAVLLRLRPLKPSSTATTMGKPSFGTSTNTLAKQDTPSMGKRHS